MTDDRRSNRGRSRHSSALRLPVVTLLIVVIVVASSSAAARDAIPCPGCPPRPPLTADQSRAAAAKARSAWLQEIARGGRRARKLHHPTHFRSPSRVTFLAKLRSASRRYHFKVLRVHFYKPLQLAPFVIVQSARPKRFSRDTPEIMRLLDPANRRSAFATAWAYEAFYLEARDAKRVPFLAVYNYLRGQIAGGQWARSESLYPFEHF